ncbi:adenosylcobinamide-phosphate synthase CbiB [Halorarum halobium]|uniref:adenosylcobinamide-phosphate synthase CbiB n=1 Tax=Halorarum halobium TaxID=3075121 RepID=UPI0028A5896D|nr:adenosylcobinamide-phosphate synthase CbiB [Halobaculum sp. XH14]
MGLTAASTVGLALALDVLFAEFPARVHPVALFGRLVEPFDRRWSRPKLVGALLTLFLPLGAAAVAGGAVRLASLAGPAFAAALAALALFGATSLRMLYAVAVDVIDDTEGDLDGAREAVRALVGRDAAALSAGQLRSAAVESAAENLVDGLVAPLFAFALGAQLSLPVAVAAAVWVKAVNTLDSMLGYRSKPVGWASARLDDVVMWVPARLGAVLVALAGRRPGALLRARAWRADPPSPNSGWPMATLATLLDVRLEKPGVYVLHPAAELPTAARARRGIRVVGLAGLCSFILAGVGAWF